MDPLSSPSSLFDEFLAERRYVKNVTSKTLSWYETAFQSYQKRNGASPLPTKLGLKEWVIALREQGLQPVSVNTYLKALNAFCRWLHVEGHLPQLIQLPALRAEKRVIPTLTEAQVKELLSVKPRTFGQWRLHALVCLLLDTGLRIEEALTLRDADVDHDNLLLTVRGKGRKERRVPFSFELRRVLWRYGKLRQPPAADLCFPTTRGTRWSQRNSLRAFYLLQQRLGLRTFGWHRLRHTFATNYLRRGGDVVRLSRVLGHAQVTTTMRYVHLLTDDLCETHQQVSLLNRLHRG